MLSAAAAIDLSDLYQSRDASVVACESGVVCDYRLDLDKSLPFIDGPRACDTKHFRYTTADVAELKATAFQEIAALSIDGFDDSRTLSVFAENPASCKVIILGS